MHHHYLARSHIVLTPLLGVVRAIAKLYCDRILLGVLSRTEIPCSN
ncbi:hypothetical protein VB714_10170 [Spirulina sp. 06S082]|nr:hypothetical protein [Spirulina sp. 06S082]